MAVEPTETSVPFEVAAGACHYKGVHSLSHRAGYDWFCWPVCPSLTFRWQEVALQRLLARDDAAQEKRRR